MILKSVQKPYRNPYTKSSMISRVLYNIYIYCTILLLYILNFIIVNKGFLFCPDLRSVVHSYRRNFVWFLSNKFNGLQKNFVYDGPSYTSAGRTEKLKSNQEGYTWAEICYWTQLEDLVRSRTGNGDWM
jgi:hypothetical protein